MILRVDAAVVAHLHQFRVVRVGVHPVVAFKLLNNSLDGGFHAERASAFDAFKRIFAVQRRLFEGLFAEAQLWFKGNRLLWAGVGT